MKKESAGTSLKVVYKKSEEEKRKNIDSLDQLDQTYASLLELELMLRQENSKGSGNTKYSEG